MRTFCLLAAILVVLVCTLPQPGAEALSQSSFDGVELSNGGKVILRHGPAQQVKFIKGNQTYTTVTRTGTLLTIDKCAKHCPRGYELEIEIITPQISRVSVRDGGVIETRGSFPAQAAVAAAVSDGGVVDIRALGGNSVSASIAEGGVIYTKPKESMSASVTNGGDITYWGNAAIVSAVKGGGVVTRGDAADADKPLAELDPSHASVPAIPSLPSISHRPNRRR